MDKSDHSSSLGERLLDRIKLLNAALEIGQAVSATLNQDDVIAIAVNTIADRFGYYHVALFLTDSTNLWAELKNATGKAGQVLKQRGYKLVLAEKSAVSTAITTRQARIALDIGVESVQFDNPLLQHTRSEVALPLMVGERVIGALDLQSSQKATFSEEDINILQGMANQLAIALENARLFTETLNELNDFRTVQNTHSSKKDLTKTARGLATPSETPGAPKSVPALNVPLTLHLVEAVASQAALADENARLYEDASQRGDRERLVSEIVTRIRTSNDPQEILQTALDELKRVLRTDNIRIRPYSPTSPENNPDQKSRSEKSK